jgi:Tol biopolymer transport system component
MTRGRAASSRAPRDPYGIGPVSGYVGPAVAVIALLLIASFTVNLFNGQLPIVRSTTPGSSTPPGVTVTPAPSNEVITPPEAIFQGSIVYAKAGNIWIQTGAEAHQLTDKGHDSQPTVSFDGQWIYFVRVTEGYGKFPAGGFGQRSWYDLDTPAIMRIKIDGSGQQKLLNGRYSTGGNVWFYWIRQPVPNPDGKTVTVISDGPNPQQSDIVLKTYNLASKKLTSMNQPDTLDLGHQDPAWRPDGRFLLYVRNARSGTTGAPQIWRYDAPSKKSRALSGPGFISPAYSFDGKWIAATRTDGFGTNVSVLDGNGKEVLRITDDGKSFSPIWSPNGDAIAYLHLEGTIVDLKMAKLDASSGRWAVTETVDLTKVSGLDAASRPSWFIPGAVAPTPSAGNAEPSSSAAPSAP